MSSIFRTQFDCEKRHKPLLSQTNSDFSWFAALLVPHRVSAPVKVSGQSLLFCQLPPAVRTSFCLCAAAENSNTNSNICSSLSLLSHWGCLYKDGSYRAVLFREEWSFRRPRLICWMRSRHPSENLQPFFFFFFFTPQPLPWKRFREDMGCRHTVQRDFLLMLWTYQQIWDCVSYCKNTVVVMGNAASASWRCYLVFDKHFSFMVIQL